MKWIKRHEYLATDGSIWKCISIGEDFVICKPVMSNAVFGMAFRVFRRDGNLEKQHYTDFQDSFRNFSIVRDVTLESLVCYELHNVGLEDFCEFYESEKRWIAEYAWEDRHESAIHDVSIVMSPIMRIETITVPDRSDKFGRDESGRIATGVNVESVTLDGKLLDYSGMEQRINHCVNESIGDAGLEKITDYHPSR